MKNFNVGVIGLGKRGMSLMKDILLDMENVTVTAVCDVYEDRAQDAAKAVEEKSGKAPVVITCDYKDVLASDAVDAVLISTAWEAHVYVAIAAMESGKAVALEVGGAYSVNDCWRLVDTYERTGTPFMLMENCCFGRRELMALNMVRLGLLGEVIHCDGGYKHDLRREIAMGKENRHYRLRNYINRNCENYPTHELGPIAKVLGLNRGNRVLTLSSTASKAAGMHEYIKNHKSEDAELMNTVFHQGDIVTTVLKCAGGQTITLTLDTTLPRYYSRNFTVHGTRGMYEEVTDSVFLDREEDIEVEFKWRDTCFGNAKLYQDEYDHPIWKEYVKSGVVGSHDGMDWLEFKAFFEALEKGEEMPVDVYDAALWMSITELSEFSIAKGGAVVDVPDFTRGAWVLNKPQTSL